MIEHLADDVDKVSGLATHPLNVQREGKPMVATAMQHYEQQLSKLATQRERMREISTR